MKGIRYIFKNRILFLLVITSCSQYSKNNSTFSKINSINSVTIPFGMSKNATLLNLGSGEEEILVWADYIGNFIYKKRNYSHIHGLRFCYVYDNNCDTLFYESLELRSENRKFNFNDCKISEQITGLGDLTIKSINNDSITLFNILERKELRGKYKNKEIIKLPSIEMDFDYKYIYSDYERLSISQKSNSEFEVNFIDYNDEKIAYKFHGNIKNQLEMYSFLNREDGRIYFIGQNNYIYPVDKSKIKMLTEN